MNGELIINADVCYRRAEQRAADYFTSLCLLVSQKNYINNLIKDIEVWKYNHIHHYSLFSIFSSGKGKSGPKEYHHYIQWLKITGKLDNYLDRSISYLFMRDLGKDLDKEVTLSRIRRVVGSIKRHLEHSTSSTTMFSMARLYRQAEKDGIESTMIWLTEKLKTVASQIPEGMNPEHAQRKLIKIIAGVLMNELEEMGDELTPLERSQKLDQAIRLGYSYGLTYPFIDDLLDANILSDNEKIKYSHLIRSTLITGSVPELGEWARKHKDLLHYIHSELREAFEYIKAHQHSSSIKPFLEQAYVFFHSQEVDRKKHLLNDQYTNEEIYIPIILKSASSRLIVRSVISADPDEELENRTFFYGIYNQLADDFADMFDDLNANAVTPYTYYLKHHDKRPDLINPFELYWAVIFHLIHNVYHSSQKTREIILDRAINGLKRFKDRHGIQKYNEVMELLSLNNRHFQAIIERMVDKADDVDFFDKLLRDEIITILKNERKEQKEFLETIKTVRYQINNSLYICNTEVDSDAIVEAANYSLKGDGKRIRPIMTWVMAVKGYGLKQSAIVPLLRSLEYMHTASLIFDDLPSQDNASFRRGRQSLHEVYNVAVAELTGLFLTQKAIEEQAALNQFDPKAVLKLIHYSARVTEDMCKGQAMDLDSKGKPLTLEQLTTISFYKTGLAFEAALIMPGLLAEATDSEQKALKKFARHAGIAFQIKDDLLDVEGDVALLGKPVGKDAENNHSTFVSILGLEGAKQAMWHHYCLGVEALEAVPHNTSFLKQLLNYIVHREH